MFFFWDNAISGSKCLKPADVCRIAQGIYTPLKKIVTISGVLGVHYVHPMTDSIVQYLWKEGNSGDSIP